MRVEEIEQVAVLGAGIMGAGIAQTFAEAGFRVRLHARRESSLEAARRRIRLNQRYFVDYGLYNAPTAEEAFQRIQTTTRLEETVEGAQFVSENVPEVLELKKQVFAALGTLCHPQAILSSDTSGFSITEIAEATSHPERVAVMHWWNPPHVVPLVEILPGRQTAEGTIQTIKQVAERIGKIPVVLRKEVPGFIGNRIQFAILREAFHILREGVASAEDIDKVVSYGPGFRFPAVGPFQAMDLGGLDTFHRITQYLFPELGCEREVPPELAARVEVGKFGAKTLEGFYRYTEESLEEVIRRRDIRFVELLKVLRNT